MVIDFGKTAEDYGRYRAGFPDTFFEHMAAVGIGVPGQRLLDLGTGAGTLARGFARRGCTVTGLDPSTALTEVAQQLDREAGVRVEYVTASAEATGMEDGTFDVVTAGQCWHWFDRSRAAAEAHRVLRPGGRLVIAHFDWIPLPGTMVWATEELILRHNPDWKGAGGMGLYPRWLADVVLAGFTDVETFSYDEPVRYSHESWRGRVRASAGIAASLPPDSVARFDRELAALLAERYPQDPQDVPHRVFALTCRKGT